MFEYRNVIDFVCSHSTSLNPAILLNLHVSSRNFMCVGFSLFLILHTNHCSLSLPSSRSPLPSLHLTLGFPIYKIMTSLTGDSFSSSFSDAFFVNVFFYFVELCIPFFLSKNVDFGSLIKFQEFTYWVMWLVIQREANIAWRNLYCRWWDHGKYIDVLQVKQTLTVKSTLNWRENTDKALSESSSRKVMLHFWVHLGVDLGEHHYPIYCQE